MAAPTETNVFRCGGVLWINPTSVTGPAYGTATAAGLVAEARLSPVSRQFNVTGEEYGGEATDAVHMGRDWVASLLVRGWDNDTLPKMGFFNTSTGSSSSNKVISEPGGLAVGSLLSGQAVKLLFVPFNTAHKGFLLYKALPNLKASTILNFSIKRELSFMAVFRCIRDTSGRHLQIAQVADMTI